MIDIAPGFGVRPAVSSRRQVKIPVIFPVERELAKIGRSGAPIAGRAVVAGEGFEPPTLGL